MNPGRLALAKAVSQIGVKEATGKNDGTPSERYAGGRVGEPWCAHFVSWCFRDVGHPLPGDRVPTKAKGNPIALVAIMEQRMREAGHWLPPDTQPEPGDVVFFRLREASDAGTGRHVGIVLRATPGRLFTIEGNTGNAVGERSYLRAWTGRRITGYGRMPT